MVIVEFRNGARRNFCLGADFVESQGWVHIWDCWGSTINSFDESIVRRAYVAEDQGYVDSFAPLGPSPSQRDSESGGIRTWPAS
jgi:hypothetical protein